MSVAGVHVGMGCVVGGGVAVVVVVVRRGWVRGGELRPSVGVIMGVHGCECADGQFDGGCAFHSAQRSPREIYVRTKRTETSVRVSVRRPKTKQKTRLFISRDGLGFSIFF